MRTAGRPQSINRDAIAKTREIGAFGATTVTSALHGQVRSEPTSRAEFFTLISANQQKEVHHA